MAEEIVKIDNEDFLELAHEGYEKNFIKDGTEILKDVGTDILETAMGIPYIGSMINLIKLGGNIRDLVFLHRIATFFEASKDLTDDERNQFFDEVQRYNKWQKAKLADYLTSLIAATDNDEKAMIMGWIYGERVKNAITNEMMLRLCSIVNKSFLSDLRTLEEYADTKVTSDYVSTNLFSLGLIKNIGFDSGSYGANEDIDDGGIRYTLSTPGRELFCILRRKGWL